MKIKEKVDKEGWLYIAQNYGQMGAKDLGEKLGVSKQRVSQIARKLRTSGIDIPILRDTKVKEIITYVKENL